jgi:hypothetical protein
MCSRSTEAEKDVNTFLESGCLAVYPYSEHRDGDDAGGEGRGGGGGSQSIALEERKFISAFV